jgi:hypothetical protein
MDQDFEQFWAIYPRKVAKAHALKMWRRLTSEEKFAALHAIPIHARYWHAAGRETDRIPHAGSWLNPIEGRRWEDELEMPDALKMEWWKTKEGIEAKAKETGCWPARANEGWHELKARILAKLKVAA